MSQVNLNKEQGENEGQQAGTYQDPLANAQNQGENYQDPLAAAQNQGGNYQDPLANTQNQGGNYQDPLANTQNQGGFYQDPLQNAGKEPTKKKMGSSDWVATVLAVVLVRLIGVVGALICFGGYWAVRAIIKSRMSVGAKVALSILVGLAFVLLFIVFLIFSVYLSASLN